MKSAFFSAIVFLFSATTNAQTTAEKNHLRNDLVKERNKQNDVARDLVQGRPQKARADHRQAIAYHKQAHRDAKRIHQQRVQRAREHMQQRRIVAERRHHIHHRRKRY